MSIVIIGSIFVDIKGFPLHQFVPTGRNAGRIQEVHGGVCRNVAEDIANVELRPTFVSLVDQSGTGTDVISKLKRHKINTDYIRRTDDGMGTWLALFDNNGDVYASISKRPDLSPIADIIKEHETELFPNCDSIVVEFDMDPETVKYAIACGKKYHKDVYAVISNMSIAMERRDLLKDTACFVCNQQEAGLLFSEDFDTCTPEKLCDILQEKIIGAQIPQMVITMGEQGAVYASLSGEKGICPAKRVHVQDTTGAGDAFFSGVAIGLTYGKTLSESCEIGTRLAASVICTLENVCPRFLPGEFGLCVDAQG